MVTGDFRVAADTPDLDSDSDIPNPKFRGENMQRPYKGKWLLLAAIVIAILISPSVFGQETSAGIQGTVKDPTGALVARAKIEVASPALIGTKKAESDSAGYYQIGRAHV